MSAAGDTSDSMLGLPHPVAFVLGGGGSLGAVQVGMLQALTERRVAPDFVFGASVGSLNGAVIASDPTSAANRLSHAWVGITRDRVFPGGLLSQARTLQRSKNHLFSNTGLAQLVTELLGATTTFADLSLPFTAVTTDMATATPRLLDSGPLLPALLASAAIPGIFPPVVHDGRRLCDGGLVANVPVRQALAAGAQSIVILDCTFPGHLLPPPDSLAETLLYTAMVSIRSQAVLEAPSVAANVPVIYLPGPAACRCSPFNFNSTEILMGGAYEASRSFLRDLDIDGPGLYGSPSER
jgi:NTE family protein